MSNVFFTADNHFDHDAIRRHCNRPFDTVEEMSETMIQNWNSVVGRGDTVRVLGDFSWSNNTDRVDKLLDRLNGNKHLCIGNHDSKGCIRSKKWGSVKEIGAIRVDKQPIALCHYPIMSWRKKVYEAWMLHGHCHGNLRRSHDFRGVDWNRQMLLDVGVDEWDFTPVPFEVIKTEMEARKERFKILDWRKIGNCLPMRDCYDQHLYWINARNSRFGIYNKKDQSFTIRRVKFSDIFLFPEDHYDIGHPHGTAKPLQLLERCPEFKDDDEKLAYLEEVMDRFDPKPHDDLDMVVSLLQAGCMLAAENMKEDVIAKIGTLFNLFPGYEEVNGPHIKAAVMIPLAIERAKLGIEIDSEFFDKDEWCMKEFERRWAIEDDGVQVPIGSLVRKQKGK